MAGPTLKLEPQSGVPDGIRVGGGGYLPYGSKLGSRWRNLGGSR